MSSTTNLVAPTTTWTASAWTSPAPGNNLASMCSYLPQYIIYHNPMTLTAMNTIRTIVITITTAGTSAATTITITTNEYLFTSTISLCHMSCYISTTLTAMTTNLTISRYSHWHQSWTQWKCFNYSHQKNGRCVLSAWLRNGHVHARLRGKKIIKMATKS